MPVAAMVNRSVNKDLKKRAAALATIGYDAHCCRHPWSLESPVSRDGTVQHSLKTLGYSVKKLRKAAAQHDELTRQQRKADILSCFTADQLVFVDESSKIDRTSERRYGRAVAGERACEIQSFKRGVWARWMAQHFMTGPSVLMSENNKFLTSCGAGPGFSASRSLSLLRTAKDAVKLSTLLPDVLALDIADA
ncbi:hypothetical protein ONZ51_g3277 [Trametes cubensis]|uniref:Uncharacterized protein n=1 Tax=Trametes cubensis TaxID=1111947 RepID=A0AAD7XD70_9APHY|nr:hypothetical protein ONZ51_g3277 [Trametes cubensis]